MNSLLIATFDSEPSARAAMKSLDALASDSAIDLYQRAIIRKKIDGRMQVFKGDVSDEWQTLAGAGLGSLIGLFAGPVGFIIGLLAGAAVGSAVGDLSQYAFGKAFLNRVRASARVGTVSIVAHMGERGRALVDCTLLPLGAEISRSQIDTEDVKTAEVSSLDADAGRRLHTKLTKFENEIGKNWGTNDI